METMNPYGLIPPRKVHGSGYRFTVHSRLLDLQCSLFYNFSVTSVSLLLKFPNFALLLLF